MKRTTLGLFVCLALCCAVARADDSEAMKNCIAAWTTACSKDCTTAKCVSTCTTQAHEMCAKDVTKPQHAFDGPVVSIETTDCSTARPVGACTPFNNTDVAPPPPAGCSTVSGTVADRAFWGGSVTVYVVCPAGLPAGHGTEAPTTTILGRTLSSPTDGKFTMTVSNSCSGQTGCYGLIAVAPPACAGCGPGGDPGWNTCTSAVCPSP